VQVSVQKVVQVPREVPQIQFIDEVVDVPVQKQRQVPMIMKVQRTVVVPQVEYIDHHVEVPVHKHARCQ
jgi:hypothetical protein